MSSLLNASNDSDESEEFSLKGVEVIIDSDEQKWFKQAHVGKFVGIEYIRNELEKCEILTRQELIPKTNKLRWINFSHFLRPCMSL